MCLYKKLLKHADSLLSKRTNTNTGQQDMYGRTFMQSLFSFSSLLSFPSFFSFSLFSHSAFFLRSLCSWTECWFYSKPKKLSLLLKKGWKKTVSLVLLRLEPETLKKHKHWLVHANTHTPTHTNYFPPFLRLWIQVSPAGLSFSLPSHNPSFTLTSVWLLTK